MALCGTEKRCSSEFISGSNFCNLFESTFVSILSLQAA